MPDFYRLDKRGGCLTLLPETIAGSFFLATLGNTTLYSRWAEDSCYRRPAVTRLEIRDFNRG
jgi:hypothetical protein